MNIFVTILAIIFGTIYIAVLGQIILYPITVELNKISNFFERFEVDIIDKSELEDDRNEN